MHGCIKEEGLPTCSLAINGGINRDYRALIQGPVAINGDHWTLIGTNAY